MASVFQRMQFDQPPVHPSVGGLARTANALLGVWLALSGWIWEQPFYGRLNAYTVGAAITIVAINGFWFPTARFFNTGLAIWLALSVKGMFGVTGAARWNAYAVALAVFLISLVPSATRFSPERPER